MRYFSTTFGHQMVPNGICQFRELSEVEARELLGYGFVNIVNPLERISLDVVSRRLKVNVRRKLSYWYNPDFRLSCGDQLLVAVVGAVPRVMGELTDSQVAETKLSFRLITVLPVSQQ